MRKHKNKYFDLTHTSSTRGWGQKVKVTNLAKNLLFQNAVILHIEFNGMRCTIRYKHIFDLMHALDPRGGVKRSDQGFFSESGHKR